MEISFADAIASLKTTVEAMLPPLSNDDSIHVAVYPTQMKPTGLGGFVASQVTAEGDIGGDIRGAQVEAEVRLSVQSAQPAALRSAVDTVVARLGDQSRQQLLQQGLLKFRLASVGELTPLEQDGTTRLVQSIRYQTLYEFLQIPTESEDIIQTIPLSVEVA